MTANGGEATPGDSSGEGVPTSVAEPESGAPGTMDEIRYLDLIRRRQQAGLPPPMAQEPLLPLHRLDPEMFERLVAEYVWRLPDTRDVRLYGRRGQEDYGLDAVATSWSGTVTVYQAKRYQELTPSKIRAAVEEYAGPPRLAGSGFPPHRFAASRFVLVSSALLEGDTRNVDTAYDLRSEYASDIDIDVIGAEQMSRVLHDAASVVNAIFGPDWARVFCGVEVPPVPPQDPSAYGLLEDPLIFLELDSADRTSRQVAQEQPSQSARIDAELADELASAGFAGHALTIRRRGAYTLLGAGQTPAAFTVLQKLALSQLLDGEALDPDLHFRLLDLRAQLGQVDQARLDLLIAIHDWPGTGSGLGPAVPALAQLHAAGDPDAAVLTCVLLEHALIDGIFERIPSDSVVADCPDGTDALAQQLLALAANARTPDRLWRARIRCASADAGLERARAAGQVPAPDAVYRGLIDDASAGRYPPGAASLVLSRAARAHALTGAEARAIDLWRRSIMAACDARLYGDVRDLFRAIQVVAVETDLAKIPNLSQVAQGLPNQDRMLAGTGQPALTAFEASHNGKLPDAFEDARRCLREARLSGHLCEEMIYLRLFGDVLAAADEPAAAVHIQVAAGEGGKAAGHAATLGDLVDMDYFLSLPYSRLAAAAAQVVAAQAQLIPDEQVDGIVTTLLDIAEKPWRPTGLGADPRKEALEAICRLGIRLPGGLADRLLSVLGPPLATPSGHTQTAVKILVNLYWALPEQRAELASRISGLLGQPIVQPYVWGLLASLPEGYEHLRPAVEQRADQGEKEALLTLATWGVATPSVQLAARTAAASLLRKQIGLPQPPFTSGLWAEGAQLLAALLKAGEPLAESSASELWRSQQGDESAGPDEAAILAAGDRSALGATCAEKLAEIASDSNDAMTSRHHAVAGLRLLLPHLPGELSTRLAESLYRLHKQPGLSEQDLWDLESLHPLSRGHIDSGARTFSALVLLTAAEACQRASASGNANTSLVRGIADAAEGLVHNRDADVALIGARTLAELSRFATDLPIPPVLLAAHPDERIRAQAVSLSLAVGAPPGLIGKLAQDASPNVRAAVAREAERATADQEAAQVIQALAADKHYAVRHAYARRRGAS